MIKYMASRYVGAEIGPVDVDRETESSVWVNGRRRAKNGDYVSYFDTWEEARNHLLSKVQVKIDAARRRLQGLNSEFGNIKGMKPPAEQPHE